MSGRRRHLLTASGSWVLSLCNGAPRLPGHPGRRMLVSGRTLNTPRHVITNKPRDVFSERTVLCRDAFSALLAAGGTRAAGRTPGCASPSRVGGAHRPAPRRTEHKRAWRPSEPALPRLRCPSLRSTACACSHDTAVAFAFLLAAGRRHSWAPGWATGPRALAGSAVLGARRLHRPPVPTLPLVCLQPRPSHSDAKTCVSSPPTPGSSPACLRGHATPRLRMGSRAPSALPSQASEQFRTCRWPVALQSPHGRVRAQLTQAAPGTSPSHHNKLCTQPGGLVVNTCHELQPHPHRVPRAWPRLVPLLRGGN